MGDHSHSAFRDKLEQKIKAEELFKNYKKTASIIEIRAICFLMKNEDYLTAIEKMS